MSLDLFEVLIVWILICNCGEESKHQSHICFFDDVVLLAPSEHDFLYMLAGLRLGDEKRDFSSMVRPKVELLLLLTEGSQLCWFRHLITESPGLHLSRCHWEETQNLLKIFLYWFICKRCLEFPVLQGSGRRYVDKRPNKNLFHKTGRTLFCKDKFIS